MRSLGRPGARAVLRAVALVTRVIAVALCILVIADSLDVGMLHTALLGINGVATGMVPEPIQGLLVFRTPMGGAFRGDFALVAIVLFVIDWLLARAAYRI
ncbi:hypothetical protein [Olsenella sp. Marseille-P4559]|uniref:hypothetical protein n=1 Tax=Olsenella sp. Marseille-P4559 TaxID=2364795 RepID=UPI0010321FE3|nr:hypothetical protein [Olsenella sp. Marseille-P4559]